MEIQQQRHPKDCIVSKSILSHKKYFIYGLYDNMGELFYIGLTTDPKKRHTDHSSGNNRAIAQIVYENGFKIDLRIIAVFYDENLAKEYEAILLKKYIDVLKNKKNESHRL